MSDVFDLDKSVGIFIYGCGDTGQRAFDLLTNDGYNVKGFIDRNAKNIIELKGLPVYDPSMIGSVIESEDVVTVALHNGMEQEKVAALLFQYGINRTLYLPMHVCFSYENRRLLRHYYQLFTRGNFDGIKNVPVYRKPYDNDVKIINTDAKHICFWCPIDCIFWYNLDGSYNSLMDNVDYVLLFNWLKDETLDITPYLKFAESHGEYMENFLDDRREMFKVFEDALKHDMLFFTDAPARIFYNEAGKCFTIMDGSHRSHFLISKGYKEVPAITPRADFELWRKHFL